VANVGGPNIIESMFESLVTVAAGARGGAAVGAWARVENAACARRLSAIAEVLAARLAGVDAGEREQWCVDNWDAVAAEVAAAHGVSLGVASHQLLIAQALRERLPQVGEVFATGQISYRLVAAVVSRTRLVTDPAALAKIDAEVAAVVGQWGPLSAAKTEAAIDYWVDRYDPYAVVRAESSSRGRHVEVKPSAGGSGLSQIEGWLFEHDAEALDKRLEAMAHAVCEGDPRTMEQRRSDALGVLGHGGDRLGCLCGQPDCVAAEVAPSAVVVNVVAEEKSLADDTAVQLDGAERPGPTSAQLRTMTIGQALAQPPATGPANTPPAVIMGGGILPAPLLAAKLATTATIRWVIHPGDSPPEPRYVPSAVLARFVRCRDLTCRFPGCDEPADHCDVDHTIPYPVGPTCASNLKCLCRKHHLLKTFWRWLDKQLPDGTVIWTTPAGQTHTTHPGSRLLFPSLCKPTAPVTAAVAPAVVNDTVELVDDAVRCLKMPRRNRTRAQDRAVRIDAERARNRQLRENIRSRESSDGPEKPWGEAYLMTDAPPPGDPDPPPF
jgi:Domain of unknown function (DUF222)